MRVCATCGPTVSRSVADRPRLDDLLVTGRLKRHRPSPAETGDLLALAARQLADASAAGLSPDGCFAAAYSSALTLATVVVRASAYRVASAPGHHRLTIELLPVLLGDQWRRGATYLDACRRKRNTAQYDHADTITAAESHALRAATRELQDEVIAWLAEVHPELLSSS